MGERGSTIILEETFKNGHLVKLPKGKTAWVFVLIIEEWCTYQSYYTTPTRSSSGLQTSRKPSWVQTKQSMCRPNKNTADHIRAIRRNQVTTLHRLSWFQEIIWHPAWKKKHWYIKALGIPDKFVISQNYSTRPCFN